MAAAQRTPNDGDITGTSWLLSIVSSIVLLSCMVNVLAPSAPRVCTNEPQQQRQQDPWQQLPNAQQPRINHRFSLHALRSRRALAYAQSMAVISSQCASNCRDVSAIASMTFLSRPSEKLGTHSTSCNDMPISLRSGPIFGGKLI